MRRVKIMKNRGLAVLFGLTACLALASTAYAGKDGHEDTEDLAVDEVKGGLSVMVLGSGGPIATAAGRASASYLIFIDGVPKILMDAGGGAYKSLAMSGVDVKDLEIILLSHLHIDHTGDMSAIVKTMYFHNRIYNISGEGTFPPGRTAPFRVFGPAANGVAFPPVLEADPTTTQYPASSEYVHGHYDVNTGLERYLNIFTRAISGGIFNYKPKDVSANWTMYKPETIVNKAGLVIKAVGVNHGPVPALAFRIEYKGKSIVYSGDTSSKAVNPDGEPLANGGNMVAISENADLLIYDTALGTDTPPGPSFNIFYALHTTPSRIGEIAASAEVKNLLLSHITPQTENSILQVKSLIRAQGYSGEIEAAEDLDVINLMDHDHHH